MPHAQLSSAFLEYLLEDSRVATEPSKLPPLMEISKKLGISVPALREQMEVARSMGLVEARPRTGIRRLPYRFAPAVWSSLAYAIALDPGYFQDFADLRRNLEISYWHTAAAALTCEDHQHLKDLVAKAWEKLHGSPIQIPHAEHRALHLTIYIRLQNPFVQGLLEAYWDAYEAVGLSLYADYHYLQEVWVYHQEMVEAICAGDLEAGYQSLVKHTDLFHHLPVPGESGMKVVAR
jgi:DNA-binding FadR family transcriptional regulator